MERLQIESIENEEWGINIDVFVNTIKQELKVSSYYSVCVYPFAYSDQKQWYGAYTLSALSVILHGIECGCVGDWDSYKDGASLEIDDNPDDLCKLCGMPFVYPFGQDSPICINCDCI